LIIKIFAINVIEGLEFAKIISINEYIIETGVRFIL